MRIKHFQGYGCVKAIKVKDTTCTLHIRVQGNHECGLRVHDLYDAYRWLVVRFDKNVPEYYVWERKAIYKRDELSLKYDLSEEYFPIFEMVDSYDEKANEDVCDYIFNY